MNFTTTPFGVPNSVEGYEKINNILKESLTYQKECRVSNACGFVNVILKHCFEAAGINTDIVYGTATLYGLRYPHVWLTLKGHIVDNTYVDDLSED